MTPTTNTELPNSSINSTSTTLTPSEPMPTDKDTTQLSPQEARVAKIRFDEEPLHNLLAINLDELSPEDVRQFVKELRNRQTSAQTFQATLRDEAAVIEKKPRGKKITVEKLLADLD